MTVAYDAGVDAAYIYLAAEIRAGGVARTLPVDPRETDGTSTTWRPRSEPSSTR